MCNKDIGCNKKNLVCIKGWVCAHSILDHHPIEPHVYNIFCAKNMDMFTFI